VLNSHVHQTATFQGNSAHVQLNGPSVLELVDKGEVYDMSLPGICVRGIVFGERRVEWVGKLNVKCAQTGCVSVYILSIFNDYYH